MVDIRPIGYVTGLLVTVLGATMFIPLALDWWLGDDTWTAFALSAFLTILIGALTALACANAVRQSLSIQQTFLLTSGVWLMLPVFGALPFAFGHEASFTDAFFEAMSGLTTTGSTVFTELERMSKGLLLWRGILQWFGGIGIIVVAMVFLPELRVGGMQIFRSEAFDTFGKVLPRATEIASRISVVYLGLTGVCALSYLAVGVLPFDAVVHAMTTVATGGFANTDASFTEQTPGAQYVGVVFMLLAALPFVRFVQILAGTAEPLWRDPQVRVFFMVATVLVVVIAGYKTLAGVGSGEPAFRAALFNVTSILTGTGYSSDNYNAWGAFPVMVIFLAGLIGGCAGSTACSIKIFRYQLLFASIRAQLQRIRAPHGVFTPRYGGRPIDEEVLSSVMSFFMFFIVTLGVLAVALAMTGLDFVTSVSGAATALANIGPGLGDTIGPTGSFESINPVAKWLLAIAMLVGRLELLAVYAILTVQFWRA